MRQNNERNIDLIHSPRTQDGSGGKENLKVPLKDSNLTPSDFTI